MILSLCLYQNPQQNPIYVDNKIANKALVSLSDNSNSLSYKLTSTSF